MSDLDKSYVPVDSLLEIQNEELCRQHGNQLNSHARYRGIVESAMDAIICLDENLKIETFNRAAEQMFGYDVGAMIGEPIDRLIPARHRNSHDAHLLRFRKTGATNRKMDALGELRGVRADGSEFPIEIAISKLGIDGANILTAIVRDISERKAGEEEVRRLNATLERRVAERTAELESTLQSLRRSEQELTRSESKALLSIVAASVSHELHTPISNSTLAASALSALMQQLKTSVGEGGVKRSDFLAMLAEVESCCDLVERNLQRAEQLLRSFRQVAADQASEQQRRFDLAHTVREVINTLAPTLKQHSHRIDMNIPPGIAMDSKPGPLGQVVINLINNAYLHAFEDVSNGVLTIDAEVAGQCVTLRIADNGVGIPDEHMDKLFEPFFSTKIDKGGTGLGMAIVKDLVSQSLGGTIAVRSTVGTGTRFDIRLPLILSI